MDCYQLEQENALGLSHAAVPSVHAGMGDYAICCSPGRWGILMQCKLDHTDPETLPRFLCRACNPHLIPTPDANAAFYEALRQSQAQAAEINRLAREIATTAAKIERMEARGQNRWGKAAIDPASVEGKIHAGLKRKLERLQNEHKTHVG